MVKGKRGEKQNKTKAKTKPKPKCENVKFLVLINPHNRLLIESSAHILQSTFYTPHSTFPVHSSLSCSWLGKAVLPHFFTLYRSLYLPLWWACEQHLVHFSMRYSSRTDFNRSLLLSRFGLDAALHFVAASWSQAETVAGIGIGIWSGSWGRDAVRR